MCKKVSCDVQEQRCISESENTEYGKIGSELNNINEIKIKEKLLDNKNQILKSMNNDIYSFAEISRELGIERVKDFQGYGHYYYKGKVYPIARRKDLAKIFNVFEYLIISLQSKQQQY